MSKFPFIKIISAETLVELSEINKVSYISKIFNDAYKSYLSLIILDDIEKIIEYINIGPRFSNVVLQTLLIFLKRIPPKNNKIFIIGTTSSPSTLELLETHNLFNITLQTPLLDFNDIKTILNLTNLVEKKEITQCASIFNINNISIGIKKLLMILEIAREDNKLINSDEFYNSLKFYKL